MPPPKRNLRSIEFNGTPSTASPSAPTGPAAPTRKVIGPAAEPPPPTKTMTVMDFYAVEDAAAAALTVDDVEKVIKSEANELQEELQLFIGDREGQKELGESMTLRIMGMRRLNRLAQFNNRQGRERLAAERSRVEEKYLQLQNSNHEIDHLKKEIDRCFDFMSADEAIDLVPLEEFYAQAPILVSNPEVTKVDRHAQRLARLNWEMTDRKNLSGQLQELEGRKNVLLSDMAAKEQRLDSLRPMIKTILEAAKPAQELMGLKAEDYDNGQRQLFTYLSKQLAVIYIQASAYKDIAKDEESKSSSSRSSKKKRKSTAGSSTVSERRRSRLLAIHPVQLEMRIGCSGESAVVLTLTYLTEMHVVGVKCQIVGSTISVGEYFDTDNFLHELFPGDSGVECPNPVGRSKLQHYRIDCIRDSERHGRLYKFAQEMAGCKTMPSMDDVQPCDVVKEVLKRVRQRFEARMILAKRINALRHQKFLDEVPSAVRRRHPANIISTLTAFEDITEEKFMSETSANVAELLQTECPDFAFYCSAIVTRTDLKLIAFIRIPGDFPRHSPLFVLALHREGTVETAKNSDTNETLSTQLLFLMSRFDVVLEVESARIGDGKFGRDHLFPRITRAVDRQFPLHYDPISNSFNFHG